MTRNASTQDKAWIARYSGWPIDGLACADKDKRAVKESRINGTVTYTGTRNEITGLLREHADARNASADYFTAAALTQAADEIDSGMCRCYRAMAVYVVSDIETEQQPSEPVGQQNAT